MSYRVMLHVYRGGDQDSAVKQFLLPNSHGLLDEVHAGEGDSQAAGQCVNDFESHLLLLAGLASSSLALGRVATCDATNVWQSMSVHTPQTSRAVAYAWHPMSVRANSFPVRGPKVSYGHALLT
eukprot:2865055-Amphidinium_carterae.1